MLYVVTIYGFEARAATRLVVGCESIADATKFAAQVQGYTAILAHLDKAPDRSLGEMDRADRLMAELAPIVFGERV